MTRLRVVGRAVLALALGSLSLGGTCHVHACSGEGCGDPDHDHDDDHTALALDVVEPLVLPLPGLPAPTVVWLPSEL